MQLRIIISLLACVTFVTANHQWFNYDNDYFVAAGCQSFVGGATFCKAKAATTGTKGKQNEIVSKKKKKRDNTCFCKNENSITSFLNCAYEHTKLYDHAVVSQFNRICLTTLKTNVNRTFLEDIYKRNIDNLVDIDTMKNFNATKLIDFPATGTSLETLYTNTFYTQRNRFGNITISHYIGVAFVCFTFFFVIVCGIINWSLRFSRAFNNSVDGKFFRIYKKYFSYGIFTKHLQPALLGFNPDYFETFWISIMFLYTILSNCIIGHQWFEHDTSFKSYQTGTSRYWGDRSGVILSYQLPLIFLFAGRNNFLQYLTRWKYSRFLTFHKWLARFILMEVLIHSFAMASQTYSLENSNRMQQDWYIYGIVSTVSGCLAGALAIYAIRKRFYEFFVISHVILVVMFLWTAFLHAKSQRYQDYYWACCGVWVFDRFIRIVRIFSNGLFKKAKVEFFCEEDEVFKISIEKSTIYNYQKIKPGSHVFIHFLTLTAFWQSHPFTISFDVNDENKIYLCCKVKKGLTKKILRDLSKTNKPYLYVLLDGFYGEKSYYQNFDKSVFITGNTGIVGPFCHVKYLTGLNKNNRVVLYWCVRKYNSLNWFIDELLSLENTNCQVKIFISQPENDYFINSTSGGSESESADNDSKEEELKEIDIANKNEKIKKLLEFAEIKHGRMDTAEVIDSELNDKDPSISNIAFGACAHNQVVDIVRKTLSKRIVDSDKHIEYFEEMQTW